MHFGAHLTKNCTKNLEELSDSQERTMFFGDAFFSWIPKCFVTELNKKFAKDAI